MASEGPGDVAWTQEGDGAQVVEGDTGVIQNSDIAQEDINNLSSTAPHTSGDTSSNADGATEDVGDYDPESVTLTPALPQEQAQQSNLKPSPQPATAAPKKRKTAGGFLVGDSDSEDDADAPTSGGLLNEPAQPLSRSPLHTSLAHEAPEAVSNVPPASQANNAPTVPVGAPASTFAAAPPLPINTFQPLQDIVTTLEERIKEEPRAAMDAWLDLIVELRRKNGIDQLRAVYERFLAVFPQAVGTTSNMHFSGSCANQRQADVWTAYMELELDANNFAKAEDLFKRTLTTIQNVKLLTVYLDYIRRRNDLSDPTGRARDVVSMAFEFVLKNEVVGVDRDSGSIWAEYLQFVKTGPGQVGEHDWESKKKMDSLRRIYQRAIAVPTRNLNNLWREYEQFENTVDKKLARSLIAQHSPNYMSAKSANMALDNITRKLQRTNLPRLPPAPGFDGFEEFMEQVDLWKKWIAWEKSDPLELKTEEPETLKSRIFYVYRQALMALRFWPDMWVDAAEWCWENEVGSAEGRDQGLDLLLQGIEANPESVLLALKHADRVEATYPVGEGDEAKADRGNAVKTSYVKVLDTLYNMHKRLKDKEKTEIDKINEMFASDSAPGNPADDEEETGPHGGPSEQDAAKQARIQTIQQGYSARNALLTKTISYVWIALARAMRRVQGKGAPNTPIGGMRQVFTDARARGKLASDVYVAIALMEWKVYKDNAGVKIFERGARLFPEDEYFMVEYLKFLHSRDDFTSRHKLIHFGGWCANVFVADARVVFENCVKRLTEKPASAHKARALFSYFHKYESQFGDRSQIVKLEQRMAELFPNDPKLSHFTARFSSDNFNPIAAPIIVSPAVQLRPKQILQSIERGASALNSPRPSVRQPNSPRPAFMSVNSPKRPLPVDEFEESMNPPRKMQRGESPLKGAAGRRLGEQRRVQAAPLARDISFILGLIPPASTYSIPRFSAASMVRLLRDTPVPDFKTWKMQQEQGGGRGPMQMAHHNRQVSSGDPSQFSYQGGPGRPQSPFDVSRGRIASAASTYGQIRPGSSGSAYEPPPAGVYRQDAPPPPVGYPMPTPDVSGSWVPPPQMYGTPNPVPSPYGQVAPPQQQQPPYPRYY